jgi:hypothetical protein
MATRDRNRLRCGDRDDQSTVNGESLAQLVPRAFTVQTVYEVMALPLPSRTYQRLRLVIRFVEAIQSNEVADDQLAHDLPPYER